MNALGTGAERVCSSNRDPFVPTRDDRNDPAADATLMSARWYATVNWRAQAQGAGEERHWRCPGDHRHAHGRQRRVRGAQVAYAIKRSATLERRLMPRQCRPATDRRAGSRQATPSCRSRLSVRLWHSPCPRAPH